MSSAPALRLGVIGLGDFGREHVGVALAAPEIDLVAVADVDGHRLDAVAAAVSVPHRFEDPLALIRSGECDAVTIVTPAATHLTLTSAAVDAGLGVLLEKPVVVRAEEVAELRAIADAGVVVPAHMLRFADGYRSVRERLGDPARCGGLTARRYRDIGHLDRFPALDPVLMTMIHDIDIAIWLTGSRAASVVARSRSVRGTGRDDLTLALVTDESGRVWDLGAAWLLTGSAIPDRLEAYTAHDILDLAGAELDIRQALTAQLAHFAECVRDGHASSVAPMDDALHGIAIALAIRESAARGGDPVSVAG